MIINLENITETRKQIDKLAKENKEIIIQGRNIEFNRLILENKKVSSLILSHTDKKDRLKQKDSGLNQVLCKIAKQNNITLIIDLDELLKEDNKKTKAEILSRILQNIKLIKKYKNNFKIINFNNKSQASSLLLTLGLPTDMIKKATLTQNDINSIYEAEEDLKKGKTKRL